MLSLDILIAGGRTLFRNLLRLKWLHNCKQSIVGYVICFSIHANNAILARYHANCLPGDVSSTFVVWRQVISFFFRCRLLYVLRQTVNSGNSGVSEASGGGARAVGNEAPACLLHMQIGCRETTCNSNGRITVNLRLSTGDESCSRNSIGWRTIP